MWIERPRDHRPMPKLEMIPRDADATPSHVRREPRVRPLRELATESDIADLRDRLIMQADADCEPRWKIAKAFGLSERQVYRRLQYIRRCRRADREAKARAL